MNPPPIVVTPPKRARRRAVRAGDAVGKARNRPTGLADAPVAPASTATVAASAAAPASERQVASLATLTRQASTYLSEDDLRRIREAYRFSDEAHLGQFRSSGEPYISHPIAVAEILCNWKLDADSLMAALLHDVIEDTAVGKQVLIERFGPHVADLVDGLSKLERIEFASKEQQQAESFRKMLLAMARDVRVILIKLADRLHNMQTLDAVPPDKQSRIAQETLDIYAPIANRLGLHELFRVLVDLSFRSLHPFRYRTLQKAVQAARGNRREVIGKLLEAVQKALPEAGINAEVFGREKTLYAIYRKMRDKRLSFSQVLDIYGFRVLVDTVPQCYLAMGALHGTYKPVPGRFKDYIAIPKINGYQSQHTTLAGPFGTPVEFQIRTREMQRVAQAGVAAHWLYKAEKESFTDLQKRTHEWLQSLLDIQSQTGDSLEFIEHVKVDLFPDAVYVFTPRGQIRAMPRGATIVDFAYSVHTDIGDQAVAARVNQEPVPLRTELQNGDLVEVITDPLSKANPNWLGFVRTGKARAAIRQCLKTLKYKESVELGRRLLARALGTLRIDMNVLEAGVLDRGARDAGARGTEELYADIGLGKRLAPVIARTIALQFSGKPSGATLIQPRPAPMSINGTEGAAVTYSPCCHPLPGDQIIGHLRGGHGLFVHRAECKVAQRQRAKDAERWIDVDWGEEASGQFRTEIEALVRNDRGVLGKVAAEISASEANIVHVAMDEEATESATMRFALEVRDRVHLAQVMRNLRHLSEVSRITRN
ncbi:MAG: bifunctional (p)ppGpp synthetase/guanosine-3',5'-bis(diphosphate) 3'-pyrophosphohydrolase [Burkholderiaceae bacterium]|nr:bifunctional (p)ppGpp synthetase/guanosine-3',5'-bis(diphosphate) 3'-pyrophosphohydrolase [Burkholderiaceae bacterium]